MRLSCLLLASAFGGVADAQPNVLFIVVDDLNDWVGCLHGHPDADTPNTDALAASGTLFANAHCAAPLCNPSRAATMLGLMPATSGVHGNQQDWRTAPNVQGRRTLPQAFRANGYWTGAAGKIYHANHGGECAAENGGHGGLRGFNHPASWTERFPSHDRQLPLPPVPPGQNANGLDIWHWDWSTTFGFGPESTSDARTAAWAVEQLGKVRDRPFFLAVGIYRPHPPWYLPWTDHPPFRKTDLPRVLDGDLDDVPGIAKGHARPGGLHDRVTSAGKWREAVRHYLAAVRFADRMVGRVLDAATNGPNARRTIVVLWSDHGWHLGEKQKWHKSTNWERATRVPLIVRVPGAAGGRTCHEPVSLVDLYPTLLELCGLPAEPGLDGLSLTPQLADPDAPRPRPAVTTRRIWDGRFVHSVRDRRHRLIRYPTGAEELYDLQADPEEWDNLTGDAAPPGVRDRLAASIPTEVADVPMTDRERDEASFRPLVNRRDLTGWGFQHGPGVGWVNRDGTLVGVLPADGDTRHATLTNHTSLAAARELRFRCRTVGTPTSPPTLRLDDHAVPLPVTGDWVEHALPLDHVDWLCLTPPTGHGATVELRDLRIR